MLCFRDVRVNRFTIMATMFTGGRASPSRQGTFSTLPTVKLGMHQRDFMNFND